MVIPLFSGSPWILAGMSGSPFPDPPMPRNRAWQKQGFFRFSRTSARFRYDRASNWCYLMIFSRPIYTESSQTGFISGISQNNSAAFSRISVKNPIPILRKGRTHYGATVGEVRIAPTGKDALVLRLCWLSDHIVRRPILPIPDPPRMQP